MPTHCTLVRVFVAVFLLGIQNWSIAQCDFVFDQDIPDNGDISFVLDVNDLLANDLASNQAVCAVNLRFRHSYVGDLTVSLTSPAGQTVNLIGPATDQINATNLTTWDIGFMPCGTSVNPDAGFNDSWDNNQAWQVFASYTGTYYPSSGCLEDFNVGSANGKWTLTLADEDLSATGRLLSVELVFCDNTGLTCVLCDIESGQFDIQTAEICEGGSIPDSVFIPEFLQNPPDPSIYNYTYLVSPDNGPITFQPSLVGTGWPAGNYTICGLSYARSDSVELFDQFSTMTIGEIQADFLNEVVDHCADLTSECILFTVHAIPDTTMLAASICSGSRYQVGNQFFNQPGDYIVDLMSVGGCDSVVMLNLNSAEVRARITQLDTLSCDEASTILSAAGSTVPGSPSYSWSTIGGAILGLTNQSSLVIASTGIYRVTVTDIQSGCTSIASWQAVSDGTEPFLLVPDGVLNCRDTVYTFEPIVFPLEVSFEWFGPGGFTDTVENPSVSIGGTYYLRVVDDMGCASVAQTEVTYDTAMQISTGIRVFKNCSANRTQIVADPSGQQGYEWTGPGGYSSQDRVITTPAPGTYILAVEQLNGCKVADSITVTHDYAIPNITISAAKDSIDCGEMVALIASSSAAQTVFNWSGTGFNILDTNRIEATSPGDYTVVGISPNLCSATDVLTLSQGLGLSNVLIFTDTITCDNDTASIGVISLAPVIIYRWSGPGLVDSTASFIRVTEGGTYRVVMTDITGCVQRVSISVLRNTSPIWFWFRSDTITCNEPIADLTFVPNRTVRDYEWQLPGNQIVIDSIIPATAGELYTLTVVGENGCARVRSFRAIIDTVGPLVFVEPTSYGCHDSIKLLSYFPDSIVRQSWTGPDGFVSDSADPFIYGPGNYSLFATGVNGCVTRNDISIDLDDIRPEITATAELLDCIDSVAVLGVESADTSVTFQWYLLNQQLSDSAALVVALPAQYYVVATALNNCETSDTFDVLPPVVPEVYASDDTINCRDASVELVAMSDSSNINFVWADPMGNMLGDSARINLSNPGIYRLEGTWTNGCVFNTTVEVLIDTLAPVAVARTDQIIQCLTQDIYLSATSSIGDSLLYMWSSADGGILLGGTSDSVLVRGQGTYFLAVEEITNRCTSTDTLTIFENPSPLQSFSFTIIPECYGNQAGAIIFDNVVRVETTIEYSIGMNGGSVNPVFDSLSKGDYLISVTDSFGCTLDSLITITETSSETVDLGPDQDILIGESVSLIAMLNIDSSLLSSISWSPEMPCDSCLSNTVYLLETEVFRIDVRDSEGCLASNEITVFVRERGQVYIPNVFSPNNDGANDVLTLNAHRGVRMVNYFRILDRWGNQVFGVDRVDPHTQEIAWDGRFNGNYMNPAVYAYIVEIELVTGRIERQSGDITLLR